MKLYKGDCLEVMDELISQNIKVDAIITDPPYGTTKCKWDSVIDFEEMWKRLNLLIKSNGAIVLFGSEPFSSVLRMSNIKNYKYDWVWIKERGSGFMNAKKRPTKKSEDICVFYNKQTTYNPQGLVRFDKKIKMSKRTDNSVNGLMGINKNVGKEYIQEFTNYPSDILEFKTEKGLHPCQKPVELIDYLIKTYTKENETILDFTMGSGTTGVACKILNRNFIGIEKDDKYFNIAKERINSKQKRGLIK